MAKVTPELEEMANLENAMEKNSWVLYESETDSSASTKSSYSNVPDSIVRSSRAKAEWERQLDRDFSEIEDRILRSTVELEEAYNSLKSRKKKIHENAREKKSVSDGKVSGGLELEDSNLVSKGTVSGGLELEDSNLVSKGTVSGDLELEDSNTVSHGNVAGVLKLEDCNAVSDINVDSDLQLEDIDTISNGKPSGVLELEDSSAVLNGNLHGVLKLKDNKYKVPNYQENLAGIKSNERNIVKNHKTRNEELLSDRADDKEINEEISDAEKWNNKMSNKAIEGADKKESPGIDEKNKPEKQNKKKIVKPAKEMDFYASQERISRKIQILEEQRKSTGSLKLDYLKNVGATPNELINQSNESEISESKGKIANTSYKVEEESKMDNGNKDHADSIEKIIAHLEKEDGTTGRRIRIVKDLDLKVDLNATQKSNLKELVQRNMISKSQTDLVDGRQDDTIVDQEDNEKKIADQEDNEKNIVDQEDNEKEMLERQDLILRKVLLLEDQLEEERNSQLAKSIDSPISNHFRIDTVDDRQAETCIPLMEGETVSIDLDDEVEESKSNKTSKSSLKKDVKSSSRVKSTPSMAWNCCKSVSLVTSSMLLCFVYIAVLSAVPIAMVVIGSLYLKQCPVQPYIPIYLIVGGTFGIFDTCVIVFRQNGTKSSYSCFDGIVNLFVFIWFILGCIWVYGVKHVEFYVTTDPDYCHPTCYNFAYWLFNVVFILLGASVGLMCCAMCCGGCTNIRDRWKRARGPVPVGYSRKEWRKTNSKW